MIAIWQILLQFVFRLTCGMGLAMAFTDARQVTSGFFRVHLWVLMGLNTFAALAVASGAGSPLAARGEADAAPRPAAATVAAAAGDDLPSAFGQPFPWGDRRVLLGLSVALAALSYVGAVVWLYEGQRVGKLLLVVVAGVGFTAALLSVPWASPALDGASSGAVPALSAAAAWTLGVLNLGSASLLLGTVVTGMLLGHWYLNTPTMKLAPLQRLILGALAAVGLRAAVCAAGWWLGAPTSLGSLAAPLLVFRWLSGLAGVALLAWLALLTLRVPNTQSATGILYAAVILVFLGELLGQLLSATAPFPL